MKKLKYLLILALFICQNQFSIAQTINSMESIAKIKHGVKSKRVSSYEKSGANSDCISGIKDSSSFTLFDVKGAGIIRHIWITISPMNIKRNDIIIKIFWDGSKKPSVISPIGSFFGQGWNERYLFNSLPLNASPKEGCALVCYFPMPFSNGARIEIENQTGIKIGAFYYYIDYEEYEELPENLGRFHAWYNRELTVGEPKATEFHRSLKGEDKYNKTGEGNYLIADIEGKGHFMGVNYFINSPATHWYGEGDDMIFIDGDKTPTLYGTGTEDYFNTSWGPNTRFETPYYGAAKISESIGWLGRTHVYRFHIPDPIYFDKSLRFTIEHGHNNNQNLDLSSVAYWYQETPTKKTLEIPNKKERKPKSVIEEWSLIKVRKAWLKSIENEYDLWPDEK